MSAERTELASGSIVLRSPREDDIPAIVAGCNDPEIPRFLPLIPWPYTEADARGFVAAVVEHRRAGDPERTFAIADAQSDELLGIVSVRLYDGGTVGYWLRPEARERGFMTEAVRHVVELARRDHGITNLRLYTHPDNVASQRVAEKAGFRRVGLEPHPTFRDGVSEAVRFELP